MAIIIGGNKMDIERIKKEENLIAERVNELADEFKRRSNPVIDGIIDVEKYVNSKYRICWILKETHDGGKDIGGGWSWQEKFDKDDFYTGYSPTWDPMIYITYAILNDVPYADMKYIKEDPKMAHIFRHIAYINVNKMLGLTKSSDIDIQSKYDFWKNLLHRQIEVYDPQVIIFGSTFNYFKSYLGIEESEIQKGGSVNYVVKNGKIYLRAYHPAQKTIKAHIYAEDIINAVKTNAEKIKSR